MPLVRNVGLVVVMAAVVPAEAQSLGDVARQEEARRASAAKAVKTLSNADLNPSAIAVPDAPAPASSCYMSKSRGRCVSAEELVSVSNAGVVTKANEPFESNWRREAQSIRAQLEKAQNGAAVLKQVLADAGRSPGEKLAAEKALAAARQAVINFEGRWETLERTAANQHIPRIWLEPVPAISTRNPE